MSYNANHEDKFRIRCFKCGSYDIYIGDEYGLGLTVYCGECDNQELMLLDKVED